MSNETHQEQVRAAEVIGALCLATDLGMGFPFEHGLRSTERGSCSRDAGFSDVHIEEVPVVFAVPDAAEYLSLVVDSAGPLAMALRGLTETERDAVKEPREVTAAVRSRGRYRLPGSVLCAVAV